MSRREWRRSTTSAWIKKNILRQRIIWIAFFSMNLLEKLDFFFGELLDFLHVGDDDSIYDLARKVILLLQEQQARELLRKYWKDLKRSPSSLRKSFSKKTSGLDNLRRCKYVWESEDSTGLSGLYARDNLKFPPNFFRVKISLNWVYEQSGHGKLQ